MGLEKHNRDFGQTFGKWGGGKRAVSGPIFLGRRISGTASAPSSTRAFDPVWANHVPTRNVAYSLRAVNRRAELLDAGNVLGEAALDKYSFVRDAYTQRRRSMIEDDGGSKGRRRRRCRRRLH